MNRIKELRKRDNVKQADLAKSVNVSQAALSGYETGKYEADTDTYRRIANYFDVSLDYLLGGQPATQTRPGYIRVPVLGRVAAGIPIDAIEEIIDWEDISTAAAGDGEASSPYRTAVQGLFTYTNCPSIRAMVASQ